MKKVKQESDRGREVGEKGGGKGGGNWEWGTPLSTPSLVFNLKKGAYKINNTNLLGLHH